MSEQCGKVPSWEDIMGSVESAIFYTILGTFKAPLRPTKFMWCSMRLLTLIVVTIQEPVEEGDNPYGRRRR